MNICIRCGMEFAGRTKYEKVCQVCKEKARQAWKEREREEYRERRRALGLRCEVCGKPLELKQKSYCRTCAASQAWRKAKLTSEDDEKKKKAVEREELDNEKLRKAAGNKGYGSPLKGLSMAQINELARSSGMTYGKFMAWVAYRGTLPPPKKR